jgi:hypothetical protein
VTAAPGVVLACFASLCLAAGGATAEAWTTSGLSFSDELGGVRLLGASGRGTPDDPIILVEEITGPVPATLIIRNHRTDRLNVSPASGVVLLRVVKLITNRQPWPWAGFEVELRTGPSSPSVYSDGLSFDQPRALRGVVKADRFRQSVVEDEPFDRLRFDGGMVEPGHHLRLELEIVDVNGRAVFYLVQRPIVLLARHDPPGQRTSKVAFAAQPPSEPRTSAIRGSQTRRPTRSSAQAMNGSAAW